MAERAYKLEWLLGLEKETLANMVLQQSKVIEKLQQAVKAQAVPEGWKLVPVEPTPEMMLHGSDCQHHAWNDKECPMRNSRRSIWKHMCEAAPELNKAGAQ